MRSTEGTGKASQRGWPGRTFLCPEPDGSLCQLHTPGPRDLPEVSLLKITLAQPALSQMLIRSPKNPVWKLLAISLTTASSAVAASP